MPMPEPLAWQIATVTGIRAETPEVRPFTLPLPAWRAAPRRPALRRPADRAPMATRPSAATRSRRRPTADRRGRAHHRADPRRRGVARTSTTSWWSATRIEVRGPDRRLLRLGAGARRSAAADRRRLGGRAADGDAARARGGRRSGARGAALLLAQPSTTSSTATSSSACGRRTALAVIQTLTRSQPPGWTGYARRIDAPCWPR